MQRIESTFSGSLFFYTCDPVLAMHLARTNLFVLFLLRKLAFCAIFSLLPRLCFAEVLETDLFAISPSSEFHYDESKAAISKTTPSPNPPTGDWQSLYRLLANHWQPSPNDPKNLALQLQQIAKYYNQFDQVNTLLMQLSGKAWSLHYARKEFSTRASGTSLTIKSVKIFFDPFSAGQFRFYNACKNKLAHCVASPADVLLHELLHVRAMLNEKNKFLRAGGMSSVMYPYQHEYRTIRLEQRLFRSMTSIDKRPRPVRSDHVGRHLTVACATCIE